MWEIFPDRLEKMFSGKREGILVCTHFIAIMSAFICEQCEFLVSRYIEYLKELFDYQEPYHPLVINAFKLKLRKEYEAGKEKIDLEDEVEDKEEPILELYVTFLRICKLFERMKYEVDCNEVTAITYWQLETNALTSCISDQNARKELQAIKQKHKKVGNKEESTQSEFIFQFNETALTKVVERHLANKKKSPLLKKLKGRLYDVVLFLDEVYQELCAFLETLMYDLKNIAIIKLDSAPPKDTIRKIYSLTLLKKSAKHKIIEEIKVITKDNNLSLDNLPLKTFFKTSPLFKIPNNNSSSNKRFIKFEDEEEEEEEVMGPRKRKAAENKQTIANKKGNVIPLIPTH